MTSLDFSLKQAGFTPIRPQSVDQLFSPRILTPTSRKPTVHDVTYQVPLNPSQPRVPSIDDYQNNLGGDADDCFENGNNINYFPRTSTGIKLPSCSQKNLVDIDESIASHIMLDTNNDTSKNTSREKDYNLEPIPQYMPIHEVKDSSPIRATCFHPKGDVYVVGTNSKKLKICKYPNEQELKHFSLLSMENDENNEKNETYPVEPEYTFQFFQIHRSSVYCVAFNDNGNLLATGSNDQTIHIIQYDSQKHLPKSNEYKLSTLHKGTIRDLMFMPNEQNEKQSCYLVTAGAGDNEIILTDCEAGMKQLRVLTGHESTVMSLHHWNDKNLFYSGSLDGTIKLWDVRSKLCCSTINTNRLLLSHSSRQENNEPTTTTKPVNVVRVEETGKLLVSGHKDGTCMLYDIKGGRVVQSFKAHDNEIRTLNFSPKSYYLLTAGYDNKIKLMDLQGELTNKLPNVEIAELDDKIVQTAWHPNDYNFVTTCANGTATLWALPEKV